MVLVRSRQFWVMTALIVVVGFFGSRSRNRPSSRSRPVAIESNAQPVSIRIEASGVSLGKVVREGVEVECRVVPINGGDRPAEGQDVRFEFMIQDTTGRSPVTRTYPSAWMVEHKADAPPMSTRDAAKKIEGLIQGSLFTPPELDLNTFYVVTLNQNATVSVVDPLFGFGGTKLLALVSIASTGADWVLSPDHRSIFVAMPEVNQVAIIDTREWKVRASVPGGIRPRRVAIQGDGRYLWVVGGAPDSIDAGVTVLNAIDGQVAARIRTDRGASDIALSSDRRYAFVANLDGGTVSIIDAETLIERAKVRTGRRPSSIAYSDAAKLAYVTDPVDGTVVSVDPDRGQVVNRIAIEPGLGAIRFTPNGRFAFVVNPSKNTVYVIDPTSNRMIQSSPTDEGPDRVSFSDDFAYIRHRGSINVGMITLKSAGREGSPLAVTRFPSGQSRSIDGSSPNFADSIVPAPGANAVLVASPADQSVYYYKEGLAAPIGTFTNYKREPRAILVIDRSLRERSRPGLYETVVRLDRPGRFDVVFLNDRPRVVHAFPITIEADPARQIARNQRMVEVHPLVSIDQIDSGSTFRPLFELTDHNGAHSKSGLTDVNLMMYREGGGWHDRKAAQEAAPGVYAAEFTPKLPGIYHVFIAADSVGLSINNPQRLTIRVTEPVRTVGSELH